MCPSSIVVYRSAFQQLFVWGHDNDGTGIISLVWKNCVCVCVCARVCVCSAANYVVFTLEQHRHLLVVRRRESIVPVPCFFRVCRCVLCTTIRRRQYPTVVSDGTTSRTTTTKNKKRNPSYRKLNKLITTYTAGKIYNPPLNHCSSAYTS